MGSEIYKILKEIQAKGSKPNENNWMKKKKKQMKNTGKDKPKKKKKKNWNKMGVARGVGRIFNMGGPIFDDDDYHRCMDSLYI